MSESPFERRISIVISAALRKTPAVSCNDNTCELTLYACHAERVDHVVCQPERDALGHFKRLGLVEQAVQVHMHRVAAQAVEEDVLAVPVAKAQDVADHRHDGQRARIVCPAGQPRRRLGPRVEEPVVEHCWLEKR
jgi:hypothetical protein